MATEEVNKPPSLPPYPQMILEALDALKQQEGANKSTISKFIESKYGELPAGHANLISDHLTGMKDSGELIFLKNNYIRPDPNAPPRRGRGRPPKPKDEVPLPAGLVVGPPKPRGRPRKDPNAPPTPKKPKPAAAPPSGGAAPVVSKTGRPRGRPGKAKPQAAAGAAAAAAAQNGVGVEGSGAEI